MPDQWHHADAPYDEEGVGRVVTPDILHRVAVGAVNLCCSNMGS